ncbi:hypothetical protein Hsar01_00521 [Haloferula sargassicola]|uniref:Peptidase S8/S53 domain-containing protein n=2 Tax=Haloferula sargassicola TaxID=490096 RepID=A0ABP9UJ21_9BACT
MEGGNWGRDESGDAIPFDSLRPLTTSPRFPTPFLTTFADTSCATALAARLGARLQERYPELWPETIRGLVVHSARWTARMLNGRDPHRMSAMETKELLRQVGWGEPDERRALASAESAATIVCENELQPFHKVGSSIATKDWHIHSLPWPTELLLGAEEADVTLRITLSYFIEPNPGSRAQPTRGRYRYANCGLRFEVKGPTDSNFAFQSGLNARTTAEEEDDGSSSELADRSGWVLGTQGRRIEGSLHQDVWRGPAAYLARMDQIAVLPVTGWWRTRKFPEGHECHDCHERRIRYSLIVSMESETNLPIYSTISTLIGVPVEAM